MYFEKTFVIWSPNVLKNQYVLIYILYDHNLKFIVYWSAADKWAKHTVVNKTIEWSYLLACCNCCLFLEYRIDSFVWRACLLISCRGGRGLLDVIVTTGVKEHIKCRSERWSQLFLDGLCNSCSTLSYLDMGIKVLWSNYSRNIYYVISVCIHKQV